MSKIALLTVSGVLLGLCAGIPAAQAANKVAVDMGRGLAERLCAGCHVVEPNQTIPAEHPGAPKFQEVANRPDTTAESLRKHLRTTHSSKVIPLGMPNPELTDDELAKVISYILSLREKH